MAKIVAGLGSSHSPMLSLPAEFWPNMGENDKRNRELVKPPDGRHLSYEQMLAEADPAIAKEVTPEKFNEKYEHSQRGLKTLGKTFDEVSPDVVVIFTDDQSERFFDDNMPMISVFWGDTIKLLPRTVAEDAPAWSKASLWGYGKTEMDFPVESALAYHIIEYLRDADFDIAHSRYSRPDFGGTIGPGGYYLDAQRSVAPRPQGMGHGFAFVVQRIMNLKPVPIVPISLNTCYPPNWITPKRSYALGMAVQQAIEAWGSDKRVAIACSGGLSHFVVDEELDRMALKGMEQANGEILSSLPRVRLQSATTETLNWVAAAGAMAPKKMETLSYVPVYRTPAGTGGGWAVGQWV